MYDRTESIIVEQFLFCSVNVWDALTKHEIMIQWFFEDLPSFEPRVGFKTQFPVHSETRTFTHVWEILEVDPSKSITLDWSYIEYPGNAQVKFEIEAEEEGSLIRVINSNLASFPDDIPEFQT
ncbi:MAG: hypothetical protein ACI85F_001355 [Bacteroidia bacterium]|jgi:uncharacterized protein YndB with AHSA1/START domain